MSAVSVTQLFIYPVKSLRGIAVNSAELTQQGCRWDRHWMIINPNGRFITQRQFPKMVLIGTELNETQLILSSPELPNFTVDLVYPSAPYLNDNRQAITASIWKDHCEVIDEGEAVSQWLTKAIGTPKPVRLVRMYKDARRPQSKPDLLGQDTHTLFADAAPYLITNTASLKALNEAMQQQSYDAVSMERFRPNIVIDGINAFAEHNIQSLYSADYRFKPCYPCQRCAIPTIDIATGTRHPQQQPFSLIAQLNAMPDNPKAPAFGENAILQAGAGSTIRVGDSLALS